MSEGKGQRGKENRTRVLYAPYESGGVLSTFNMTQKIRAFNIKLPSILLSVI